VDAGHVFGGLDQREGRPFGLTEGRADSGEFAAGAAVEDLEGFGHGVGLARKFGRGKASAGGGWRKGPVLGRLD
jgi:hypothetical protein